MKTLTIKDNIYEKLSKVKKPGESFSDLFDRLADNEKPSIMEFAGFLSKESAAKMEKEIAAHKKKSQKLNTERKKRLEKLWSS